MTLVVKLVRTVPSAKFAKVQKGGNHYFSTCNLTILIVFLFSLLLCLVILTRILRLKRDLYEHFFGNQL